MNTVIDVITIVLMAAGGLWLGIWMFRWQYRTAETRLRAWAQHHGYEILEHHAANPLGTGPMARSARNKQVMYRVTVSDENGGRRRGLVKIGSPGLGVLAHDLSVEWENGAS